jgi:hypothetical protein
MNLFFFTSSQNIRKITALETYSVRQAVLRKRKPLSSCLFDGDDLESTFHFGYFINIELPRIISLYEKNDSTGNIENIHFFCPNH